jgi:HEAT repeat protein
VVGAALRLTAVPELLDDVRALLAHGDWRVRVQAAKALGRIGNRSDAARLRALLGDPQWWVRYRAAQALVSMPFLAPADLDALCRDTPDRFAADMLRQVLAERITG